MELSHGHVITLDKAQQLGVLSAAEGLRRDAPDKPWEAVVPADEPVELDGDGDELDEEQEPEMAEPKHNLSLHRALSHLHKGGLHRALGVKEGEVIPADKLAAAKNSSNPHIAHMARFASVLKGFHH